MPTSQMIDAGTAKRRPSLALEPLALNAENLRAAVREAVAWGTELGVRYPGPSLSLTIPLVLNPQLEDRACAEIEAARGVLLAAAEEWFAEHWTEPFAAAVEMGLDSALANGFRTATRLGRPPATSCLDAAWFTELVECDLADLIGEVASRGYPIPGGNAVLARAAAAEGTAVHVHSSDSNVSGRTEWIVDGDDGEIRQWGIKGDKVEVRLITRRRGSRETLEVARFRRDEIPVVMALLKAACGNSE